MKVSENSQEFLEVLWTTLNEESRPYIEVDGAPGEAVRELEKLQLIHNRNNKITLTKTGEFEAAMAIRRHRLAERLLADIIQTDENVLDEHACRLEHALFDGLDESICTLLGHPRFCPHGMPIPPGNCCRQKRHQVEPILIPLCEMKPGQTGQIAYIQMNDSRKMDKILAMGILPNLKIALIRRQPSVVFQVGHSQFAVDEDIASEIYVRLTSGPER